MVSAIVVLRAGMIEQTGPPLDLYNRPANKFVAGFIGSPRMNFLDGRVTRTDGAGVAVAIDGLTDTALAVDGTGLAAGTAVSLGVRPEHLSIGGDTGWPLTVDVIEQLGGMSFLYGHLAGGQKLNLSVPQQTALKAGATIKVAAAPASMHLFHGDEAGAALQPLDAGARKGTGA